MCARVSLSTAREHIFWSSYRRVFSFIIARASISTAHGLFSGQCTDVFSSACLHMHRSALHAEFFYGHHEDMLSSAFLHEHRSALHTSSDVTSILQHHRTDCQEITKLRHNCKRVHQCGKRRCRIFQSAASRDGQANYCWTEVYVCWSGAGHHAAKVFMA